MTDDFKYSEAYYYLGGVRVDFHVDDIQDQVELHRIRGLALRTDVFSIDGLALQLVNMRQNNPDHANYMRRKDKVRGEFEANARAAVTRAEPTGIHRKKQEQIGRYVQRATDTGLLEIFTHCYVGEDRINKTLCKVRDYQWDRQVPRFLPGGVYTRNDVAGRSHRLGHYGREPEIAFEVINTVMPEERVFNGLIAVSSIMPLLVAFVPIPQDGEVTGLFCKTYGDRRMRVTHYIWDGAYWKGGHKVKPSAKLTVYDKFTKDINNARHPSAARPVKTTQEQLSLG